MITKGDSGLLVLTFNEKENFSGAVLATTEKTATATEWQGFLDALLSGAVRNRPTEEISGFYSCEFFEEMGIVVSYTTPINKAGGLLDTQSSLSPETYALIAILADTQESGIENPGGYSAVLAATEQASAPGRAPLPTRIGSQVDAHGNLIPHALMTEATIKRLAWLGSTMLVRLDAHENRI